MTHIEQLKTGILTTFQAAAERQGATIYLFGDIALYFVTKQIQFIRNNVVNLLVSAPHFNTKEFYDEISKSITVNQEFENNSEKYVFLGNGYIFDLNITNETPSVNFSDIHFNVDGVFINLSDNSIFDMTVGLKSLQSDIVTIKNLKESKDWDISDILGFVTRFASYSKSEIELSNISDIKSKNINSYKLNEYNVQDWLLDLLLSYRPGAGIGFLVNNIPGGKEWLFNKLIDFVIKHNIPLNEDIGMQSVFAKERFDLLDLYNEFFLFERNSAEFPKERTNRLVTTLRLLFDTPTLNLSEPYIDKVSIFSSALESAESKVSLFADGCSYGPCPECNPEDCNPQCCCCHSVDIVSAATVRCHKRTIISCNEDGTGPKSGETFLNCENCVTACQTILGLRPDLDGEGCQNFTTIGQSEGWWTIPSSNWPCDCSCARESSGNCILTCVTCRDLFCSSVASVTGNDCSYNISMTPGNDCCGTQAPEEIVFVLHAKQPVSNEGEAQTLTDLKSLTTEIVNRINSINPTVSYALVTFDDPHADADDRDARYAIQFTNASDFISQIPDTAYQEDSIDAPYPSPWYAAVRAAAETEWSPESRRRIIIVGGRDNYFAFDSAPICEGYTPDRGLGQCFSAFMAISSERRIRFGMATYNTGLPIDDRQFGIIEDEINTLGECGASYSVNLASGAYFLGITDFYSCVEQFTGFSSSCDCVNSTPIPIRQDIPSCKCCRNGITDPCIDDPFDTDCIASLPESCFDIPIIKCLPGEDCDCTLPTALNICGNTVLIEPARQNLVCCSELGFGCQCDTGNGGPNTIECCGTQCHDICSMYRQNPDIEEIIDFVWTDCWTKKAGVDQASTPNCSDSCCPDPSDPDDDDYPCELRDPGSTEPCCPCSLENQNDCCNCCIRFLDENSQPTIIYCRPDIAQQVRDVVAGCSVSPPPPPPWDPPNAFCRIDKCIVGEPIITDDKSLDDQCENKYAGCISVRHPSTVVLNNGIGLVAYESQEDVSVIKIQQFNTSLGNKLLPNREFNLGRLQNQTRWADGIVKLYVYDPLPQHLLSGSSSPSDESTWKDAVAFKNGPLEKQFFPLAIPPYGNDENGTFVRFYSGSNALTNPFPSPDDVYDVKFFIFDFEDEGVIGDSTDTTTSGAEFSIENRRVVDKALLLSAHIYNGQKVPVAYPSIAVATNYSEPLENSHFVYLTYQALEDNKWNVYLRQLRLSEYERQGQLDEALNESVMSLSSLNIGEVIYRAVCVGDSCAIVGSSYSIKRTVVFEVLTTDGRDVLNPSLTGNWPSLCPGHSASEFPKEKVFVQFVHSATADRCPDHEDFNNIFFNWYVGQEFLVPVANISAQGLFNILQIAGEDSVSLGIFVPPISISGVLISSSAVGAVWYNRFESSEWSVISGQSYDTLQSFKGMDIGEPTLLTSNEAGHSVRPVVKVNYNNDVFIAYETTESGLHQLKLIGTATPNNSLPAGVFRPKDPDSTLRYFLTSTDFIYQTPITMPTDSLNQMVDMFIDFNDVVHLTWQSNRDKRWEIYYANSEDQFRPKRITDHPGRSLNPSIDGDNTGKIFIAWHDDRFGSGYEILMAYYPGTRITPLSQQDPYLAGIRNSGYTHYVDEITLLLQNNTNSTICFSNIIVDFYKDRTLSQLAFSIDQSDYPFAFNIVGSENDSFTKSFDEFSNEWLEDPYDIAITSLEFDTGLSGSIITQFVLNFDSFDSTSPPVEMSFRGSEISNDVLSDAQWSSWLPITTSGTYYYATFGQTNVTGRFKQVRLRFNYRSTSPVMEYLSVTSESLHRICLASGQQSTGVLDLTPELRIDNLGNTTSEFPIPVNIESNTTYFISVRAEDDSGNSISMPNQLASISCESCINQISTWNFESCSLKYSIINSNPETSYYNFKITFYFDPEKTRKISEFLLFPDSNDLEFVTINNKNSTLQWTDRGLQIPSGVSETIVFWPELSTISGLVCGIGYYVDIEYCSTAESIDSICSDLQILESMRWFCNCKSRRWDPEFEESPVNILEAKRWISSGDGFSDTRLTETINTNNLNPIIKIRSNQNGVIIYQTNRPETGETQDENLYRIYSSIFSVVPTSDMFASGAQSIISPLGTIIHRSDVPICENSDPARIGCYDENNQRINQTIRGENISFSFDQYDNLFLAAEVPFKETDSAIECQEFTKNKQRYVIVHTCGGDALDLFDTPTVEDSTVFCKSENILGKTFFESDITSRQTKVLVRVLNNYVAYHVTKNNISMPVVNKCNIELEIIGTTETIAIRLKNGNEKEFSAWIPLSLETTSNSTIVDWRLDQGSGIRLVEFQCATHAGISQSGSLNIIADYNKVNYNINFYKPLSDTPFPPDSVDIANNAIWVESNKLPLFDGKSVASLRRPFLNDNSFTYPSADYVFVEIIPDASYMQQFSNITDETKSSGNSGIEPVFDFLHQGKQDSFGISTKWARNDQGTEVFRGIIVLNKDNTSAFKDGLASILPHFKNDCSDIEIIKTNQTQENYVKDIYNMVVEGTPEKENDIVKDVFSNSRDNLGNILHKIVIRPNEDPYFVFGDPNYRIPNE